MIETIRLFFWTHPWWHAAAVIIPPVVISGVLVLRELAHSKEANRLRIEGNRLQTEANGLRDEQKVAVVRIAELQEERNSLEREKNGLMEKIAENTKRPISQAEKNALKLRKYLRKMAAVSEGNGHWGSMGAEIVEVSEDNILTLFVPAGYSSSSAFAVYVQCDELQIVEERVGGCALQIKILHRYGDVLQLGQIRKWEDRAGTTNVLRVRGTSVFNSTYRLQGSSSKRSIFVYAPTDGNPQYTLVTLADNSETSSLYGDHVEISKRFATLQVEWLSEGFLLDGSGGGGSPDRLFLFTR